MLINPVTLFVDKDVYLSRDNLDGQRAIMLHHASRFFYDSKNNLLTTGMSQFDSFLDTSNNKLFGDLNGDWCDDD